MICPQHKVFKVGKKSSLEHAVLLLPGISVLVREA